MDIKVKSSYLRVSPRKVRPVLYNLRGRVANDAYVALKFTNKKGAKLIAALLKSAIAIGKENDLETEKLYIKSVSCTEGPRLKRRQIKARGRSDAITKRMSHLNLVISDIAEESTKKEIKKAEAKKATAKKVTKKPKTDKLTS
jgi:large subunit ribosomal protein L22